MELPNFVKKPWRKWCRDGCFGRVCIKVHDIRQQRSQLVRRYEFNGSFGNDEQTATGQGT